ncbi:MAG: hypothetical protein ACYTFQ_17420 [Planctomycetota bacterium]|jgi:hypothetical protein
MSYEYLLGMGSLGAAQKTGLLTADEAHELVKEKCGGIGCVGVTTQPVIFKGDDPTVRAQILANMSARGCFMQCLKDDVSYYCCPPFEEESATERQERIATACGGETCSEPGMTQNAAARTTTLRGAYSATQLEARGCTLRCEEDGWSYFCCPSDEEIVVEEDVVTDVVVPTTELAPVDQGAGFPWGVAILGVLVLGGAGFAGYWFLIRDKNSEKEE